MELFETQHIEHIVEAWRLLDDPPSSAQRSASKRVTTTGPMSKFDAFAHRSKHNGVISDYVTRTYGLNPDFSPFALTDESLSRIHADLIKISINGTREYFRHF